MTEREKMAQIIAEHLCPQGRAHKTLYGAERMCYSRNNFADCENVSECVDALVEAGLVADCVKCKGLMRLYPEGVIKELEHRAQVAERAFDNIMEVFHEMLSAIFPSIKIDLDEWKKDNLAIAEKELAEDEE